MIILKLRGGAWQLIVFFEYLTLAGCCNSASIGVTRQKPKHQTHTYRFGKERLLNLLRNLLAVNFSTIALTNHFTGVFQWCPWLRSYPAVPLRVLSCPILACCRSRNNCGGFCFCICPRVEVGRYVLACDEAIDCQGFEMVWVHGVPHVLSVIDRTVGFLPRNAMVWCELECVFSITC